MSAIRRGWLCAAAFVMMIVMFGCMAGSQKEIVGIKLECADFCKKMASPPFTEKVLTYEHVNQLRTFERAIGKAKKIEGALDYGAIFYMYVSFNDHTEKKYVLNTADKDGQTALLVDTAHSEQGYTIPTDQTELLRQIIFQPFTHPVP